MLCLEEMKTGKWQKPSAALLMKISIKQTSSSCNPPLEQKDILIWKKKSLTLSKRKTLISFLCFLLLHQQIFRLHRNKEDGKKQGPAEKQQNVMLQKIPKSEFPSFSFSSEEKSSLLYK